MPVVLDTPSFPHILDSIVFLAPPDALVRLRAVSRSLRRAADARLNAGQLVIRGDDAMLGPPRWVPAASRLLGPVAVVTSVRGQRVPAFASWGEEAKGSCATGVPKALVQRRQAVQEADLQATQVVDIVGQRPFRFPELSNLLKPHMTLRFTHNVSEEREIAVHDTTLVLTATVDTYVLFIPLPFFFYDTRGLLPRPNARRVIANISVHPYDFVCGMEHDPLPGCTGFAEVEEAVWIFHHACGEETSFGNGQLNGVECDELLAHVVAAILDTRSGGAATTIVGLDDLELYLNAETDSAEAMFRRLHEIALEHIDIPITRPLDQAEMAYIEFFSLDEYRARLGPERAVLETTINRDLP